MVAFDTRLARLESTLPVENPMASSEARRARLALLPLFTAEAVGDPTVAEMRAVLSAAEIPADWIDQHFPPEVPDELP